MLGAMTFGAKVAMSGLPNIEPVSLMVMLFAVVFGLKGLFPVYLYVAMELLFFPAGTWAINYLYIWAILFVAAYFMRKLKNPIFWALLSGAFGMSFGFLCSFIFFRKGLGYMLAWTASGFPYDIPHAIGNFVIALILFYPLRTLLTKLYKKMQ